MSIKEVLTEEEREEAKAHAYAVSKATIETIKTLVGPMLPEGTDAFFWLVMLTHLSGAMAGSIGDDYAIAIHKMVMESALNGATIRAQSADAIRRAQGERP